MRLLVIGKSGQLAQSLIEAAPLSGVTCIVAGRNDLDILDKNAVLRLIDYAKPEAVINAAAFAAVDKAESETDAALALNARAPRVLAAATCATGLPLIHISTDFVFDGLKGAPYLETDIPAPLSAYGRSKHAGEIAVMEENPNHAIVRTAWLVSPFGQNFLKTMLRLNAERPELRVVADQHGNPTSTLDLAPALLTIAKQFAERAGRETLAGIYHITNSGEATWHALAQEIVTAAERHGVPAKPVHAITTADYPLPAKRPADSRLDTAKAQRAFGLTLPPWQDAVAECVRRLVTQSTQ